MVKILHPFSKTKRQNLHWRTSLFTSSDTASNGHEWKVEVHIMLCPNQSDYLYLKNGKLEVNWWYSGHDRGPPWVQVTDKKSSITSSFLVLGPLSCGIGFRWQAHWWCSWCLYISFSIELRVRLWPGWRLIEDGVCLKAKLLLLTSWKALMFLIPIECHCSKVDYCCIDSSDSFHY
jgi:hypothetical protein